MQKSIKEATNKFVETINRWTSDSTQMDAKEELNINDIISNSEDKANDEEKKKVMESDFIVQAVRNSSMARIIYHSEKPEQLIEKCLKEEHMFDEIQNEEPSVSNCSKILNLKEVLSQTVNMNAKSISGVLFKSSPSIFCGWSERHCVLENNKFNYHENKNPNSPIAGRLNFDIIPFSANLVHEGNSLSHFEIKLLKGEKVFAFKSNTQSDTKFWFKKIEQAILNTDGRSRESALSSYHRFWRKDYISEKEFKQTAKTGDVLLFRGKKTSAVLQRKITGQEYDHIGVLLQNSFGDILIFQANGGFGVGLCPWKKLIKNKWYEDQDIVAVRRLKVERSEQFLAEVRGFVEQNIGKKYKFSLSKYFTNRSSTVDHENSSYFCSSLVAKLYKTLGFLDQKRSSSLYMPYHFADKEDIKLKHSKKFGQAFLENEKIIVFSDTQDVKTQKPNLSQIQMQNKN